MTDKGKYHSHEPGAGEILTGGRTLSGWAERLRAGGRTSALGVGAAGGERPQPAIRRPPVLGPSARLSPAPLPLRSLLSLRSRANNFWTPEF